jgi:hypothetical protein
MTLEKTMYQLLMGKQAENSYLPGLQTSLIKMEKTKNVY